MSFSFTAKAKTKQEALDQVKTKMADTVMAQPVHACDQEAVNNVASTYCDLVREPNDDESILIVMNGSVSSTGSQQQMIVAASVGCSVYFNRD